VANQAVMKGVSDRLAERLMNLGNREEKRPQDNYRSDGGEADNSGYAIYAEVRE
jgi:hypothetical protein